MTVNTADPLDGDWDLDTYWSTTNLGEAMPGVLTPLCWSLWGPASELSVRRAFHTMGALESDQAALPKTDRERMIGIFHGRVAASVDFLGRMGDRLPGTSGAAVAEQFLGALPPGFHSKKTYRRLPIVAVRFPIAMATIAHRLRVLGTATTTWWQQEIAQNQSLDLPGARAQWKRAVDWFDKTVSLQCLSVFVAVQPAYDQVLQAAARAGKPELGGRLLAGQGSHVELTLVEDIWRLSRNEISLDQFLRDHGYHGPAEGELASHVWREDPEPIRGLLNQYRSKPDTERPSIAHLRRSEARAAAEAELLSGLSAGERLRARAALWLGDRFVPLRGVGKVAFLQSIDVARAAARRVGFHLAQAGVIRKVDDVFFLSDDELLIADRGPDWQSVIDERRGKRAEHLAIDIPSAWRGRPEPLAVENQTGGSIGQTIRAIGASPGVAEGYARVVDDPADADVDEGEILIARTTDPGWASIMFVSAALVVDLGGLLSHAAVVARELGIPCVMGTQDGTKQIKTGDFLRVDGDAGTVEILRRE